jgi:hypothetical protein
MPGVDLNESGGFWSGLAGPGGWEWGGGTPGWGRVATVGRG